MMLIGSAYTGKLFFGGINGVIWVDPQNDRQENYKPALHFFEMKMGHETHSCMTIRIRKPDM